MKNWKIFPIDFVLKETIILVLLWAVRIKEK